MDLKDEVNDQSLDDATKTDVSTNDKCTNDVTKDEISSPDVTEIKDIPVTDADCKEVSPTEPAADGVKDSEQAATQETNGTLAESEIPAQDAEIENTAEIAQKSESRTETENSEEHTASQVSESNLEPTSNGHMSEKQERLFSNIDLGFDLDLNKLF